MEENKEHQALLSSFSKLITSYSSAVFISTSSDKLSSIISSIVESKEGKEIIKKFSTDLDYNTLFIDELDNDQGMFSPFMFIIFSPSIYPSILIYYFTTSFLIYFLFNLYF